LAHSARLPPLRAILIIAPVGAYIGRVRKGIDYIMIGHANEKANLQLRLIVSEEYSKEDPNYQEDFVKKLVGWIEASWKLTFPQTRVDIDYLKITDRDRCTFWLIETLASFFIKNPDRSKVFIDLTSAPREWFFVAMDICTMFDNVEFYNVPPTKRSVPSDFIAEREDMGTVVENVKTGMLSPPLRYWIYPKDEDGYPNEHHVLLQVMWRLATATSQEEPPQFKDLVSIKEADVAAHFKERCLEAYEAASKDIGEGGISGRKRDIKKELDEKRRKLAGMALEHVKKAVSRYLTDIEPYQLFNKVLGMYEFTEKGATMAKVLFRSSSGAPIGKLGISNA